MQFGRDSFFDVLPVLLVDSNRARAPTGAALSTWSAAVVRLPLGRVTHVLIGVITEARIAAPVSTTATETDGVPDQTIATIAALVQERPVTEEVPDPTLATIVAFASTNLRCTFSVPRTLLNCVTVFGKRDCRVYPLLVGIPRL